MRFSLLASLLVPAARAATQAESSAPYPSSTSVSNSSSPSFPANGTNSTTGPLGGTLMTDPYRLAYYKERHSEVLQGLKNGSYYRVTTTATNSKRQLPELIELAGVMILGALGGDIAQAMGELVKLFEGGTHDWWYDTSRCRTHFQTHAGGEEKIQIFGKGASNPTNETDQNVGWNNPETTDPPILHFDDPDVGVYSVQFTATAEVAWDGINDTTTCDTKGLCNPQYVFYHRNYNVVLNTWRLHSACSYSHGADCRGLCESGVYSEGTKNGNIMAGQCAIPCKDELPNNIPVTSKQAPKIMVAGDSISHGMDDDWTWRYLLWGWLDYLGYVSTFVGPFVGTHGTPGVEASEPSQPLFPGEEARSFQVNGKYADGVNPNFTGSGHASFWGRQAVQTKETIIDWVATYQPDYLLILLGFNDLGWLFTAPDILSGQIEAIVRQARKARADIKVLVGGVVQRLRIDGRQDLIDNTLRLNEILSNYAPKWSLAESPVSYVDVASYYDCNPDSCNDGYDGLHPNARGEHHIAQAFSDVLGRDFDFFGESYKVPSPVAGRPVTVPANVKTYSFPEGLFTTWDPVPNNRGYEIRSRLQGMTDWWSSGVVYPSTWGSWITWVKDGQTWEFQVRTKGNFVDRSDWSDLTSAVAHPETAPGPSNIKVYPDGADGVTVSWDAVARDDLSRYGVLLWDRDTDGAWLAIHPTTDTTYTQGGLNPNHRYSVWVISYVTMGSSLHVGEKATPGGLPAPGRELIIGSGLPGQPGAVQADVVDAVSVILRWDAVDGASGYTIYVRHLLTGGGFQSVGTATGTSQGIGLLYPGIWYYEFCIGAHNGDLESAYDQSCVTPPRCCGYVKRDVVEAPPSVNATAGPALIPSANATDSNNLLTANGTTNATALAINPDMGTLHDMYRIITAALHENVTVTPFGLPTTLESEIN